MASRVLHALQASFVPAGRLGDTQPYQSHHGNLIMKSQGIVARWIWEVADIPKYVIEGYWSFSQASADFGVA